MTHSPLSLALSDFYLDTLNLLSVYLSYPFIEVTLYIYAIVKTVFCYIYMLFLVMFGNRRATVKALVPQTSDLAELACIEITEILINLVKWILTCAFSVGHSWC